MVGFLVVFLLLFACEVNASCTAHDRALFLKDGKHYETKFRKLGGMFVSQRAYEKEIVTQHGLSPQCAHCYGIAYSCGWSHCKWACKLPGDVCEGCLVKNHCIEECNKCTNY